MRVLFIRPKHGFFASSIPHPPMGLLALASFLQSRGHIVRIFDHVIEHNLTEAVAEFKPDAAAVTLPFASTIPDAVQISRKLKELGLPVFWGGQMASAIPEEAARCDYVDYVGISEGEYTLMELLDVVQGKRLPETVAGIAYVDKNGTYVCTAERPFANLADFPVLDYSLIPMERFLFAGAFSSREFVMTTSKGCPFSCTFCFNNEFYRCQRRTFPEDVLFQQANTLVENYNVNGLVLYDEAFGMEKQELRMLCEGLEKLNLTWSALGTIGFFSRDDLKMMYAAGCRALAFGLESGSLEMRKALHKYYDASKVDETCRNCQEFGIQFKGLFIIGLPDETPEQLRETVRLYFRVQPDVADIALFTPIPGSPLYKELVAAGRLIPPKTLEDMEFHAMERQHLTQNFSGIPDKDLLVVMNYFNWSMVFGKKRKGPSKPNFIITIRYELTNLRNSLQADGLRGLVSTLWESIKLFCFVAWYAHAYPSVRKKYDLYARNFGRTDWEDEKAI